MAESASLGVLLDHAQDKVALLDDEGRFTYANDAVRRMLGWEPDELLGDSAFDYIHPDDVDEVRTCFEDLIDRVAFADTTVEYRFRAADGSWVWLESRMSNLTDEQLDGYVVSSRDVTDRVEAQRERRQVTTRLRELSATTGDVLWMFSGDWSELLFVNPAYEAVYGRPVAEVEADPAAFLEVIHPDDVPAVESAMECLSAGQSVDVEYRVNPEEDYGVWVWVQAEPIVEDGEVVRITGFTRDITDRRRRERQLYVMDNLLRHNLRNDLTTVLGNAALIEETAPEVTEQTAVIRQTGEDLLESAEKQRRIIDLLTTGQTLVTVDLADAVATGVETVRERFPGASVETTTPAAVPVCAPDEVRAAVVELLENAVTHSESDRPSVRVAVERRDDGVSLVVEDDGPPIPEMEARVLGGDHEMDDLYHSSGLGLWLVYWVVELADGGITVESDPESGNRVEVRFPRREPPEETP